MANLPSGTVTFLFTDIEGSTSLWERGPDSMQIAVPRHDALLRATIEEHAGYVFKTMGDAVCAAFATAPDALAAAIAAQRALATERWARVGTLKVRMALHTGTAIPRDGDYLGPTVNRVARLVTAGHGGQVLLSQATADLVRDGLSGAIRLDDLGEQRLKDLARPERVFQVTVADLPTEFPPLRVGEPYTESGSPPVLPSANDVAPPATSGREAPGPPGTETATVQVYLLGHFRVVLDGRSIPDDAWRRRKARQLFKLLLSRPRYQLTKDEAIDLLWPDSEAEAAAANLRSAIHAVRRALNDPARSDGLIVTDRDMIRVRADARLWVDADAFERAVARARQAANSAELLEDADALYAGDYLTEDRYEDWAAERREALKRSWAELQFSLTRAAEERGTPEAAAVPLHRLLAADACDERAARELMRLLGRLGRRSEALRVHQRLVGSLRDELGVTPSEETVAVERELAAGHLAETEAQPFGTRPADQVGHPPDRAGRLAFTCAYPFPTPERLLGRGADLEMLEDVLRRGRTGGQVVLLGAPAGTGKSTLVSAIVGRARHDGVLCLAGGCYEQEGIIPLGPFQDALADFLLAQPPERVRGELGSAAADLARVVPELRYHLELPEAPSTDDRSERVRQFGAVHACLRSLAEAGPVLLCLEDLHSADTATLELLHYLARQTRRLPLFLLGTYRVEDVRPGRPLAHLIATLTRERLAQQHTLGPLDRDDTARLATMLLDGPAGDDLNNFLHRTTAGNPLFVEQWVLALREAGRLERRADVWHRIDGEDVAVPPAIREVVDQRLDRLSPRCRETLAMVAVLGQSVQYDVLLQSIAPDDERVLLADLEEALEARLLQETATGYTFGHALLRETIYWGLSAPRRMRLHATAGETIERLAGPRASEQAAELAHHFVKAGHASAIRAKAIEYSLHAGRHAALLSSHRDALAHFARACDLIDLAGDAVELSTRLAALESRGHAEKELGIWSAAVNSFRRVLDRSDEPLQRARVRNGIGYALHHLGDTTAALTEADAGLRELDLIDDGADAVVARLQLQFDKAFLQFLQGKYRDMHAIGEQMLEVATEIDRPRPLAWAHSALAGAAMGQGQVGRGLEQFGLALAAAERAANGVQMALALENLGIQSYRGARFADARANLDRALALYRRSADERRAVNVLQALGRVWLAEGNLERAQEHAEQAYALAVEGHDRRAAECHDLMGAIHAVRCEWQAAEACLEQALEIRERVGHAAGIVDSLNGLGLVHQRRGDWRRAETLFSRAVEVADGMDPNPQSVAARRHLGRLLVRTGDQDRATAQIGRALILAESMPESIEYPPTLLALAEDSWRTGDPDTAARHAERAIALGMTAELTVEAHFVFVLIHLLKERPALGRPHADAAIELARRIGAPRLLGLAHLAAARVATALNEVANATTAFDAATPWLRAAQTPYELSLTLRDFGQLLARRQDQVGRARSIVAEALETLRKVGAQPAAAQCQQILDTLERT